MSYQDRFMTNASDARRLMRTRLYLLASAVITRSPATGCLSVDLSQGNSLVRRYLPLLIAVRSRSMPMATAVKQQKRSAELVWLARSVRYRARVDLLLMPGSVLCIPSARIFFPQFCSHFRSCITKLRHRWIYVAVAQGAQFDLDVKVCNFTGTSCNSNDRNDDKNNNNHRWMVHCGQLATTDRR